MSHTFAGECCRIHYNSDLSGEIEVQTERAEDRVKTFYAVAPGKDICITRIDGSDLLAFFRHLQQPGRALAPETDGEVDGAEPTPKPSLTSLLAFFRHLQEPGRALAPDTTTEPDAVPALTAAGYIREQIERLRKLEPEMKSFGIGSERWAAVAMAIGTLAEKLHAVEREHPTTSFVGVPVSVYRSANGHWCAYLPVGELEGQGDTEKAAVQDLAAKLAGVRQEGRDGA